MASITRLWNPRGNHKLRRHWIGFDDRIVIGGDRQEQAGVLSVRPASGDELRARLRVRGGEYEELVHAGNDIAIWINGLTLLIGVKAVDDERILVAFGIAPGANVKVTLETSTEADRDTDDWPMECDRAHRNAAGRHIGLCQTSA